MSYQSQSALERDTDFQGRAIAAAIEQATVFKDDGRADFVALSNGLLRGDYMLTSTFVRFDAAGPGIADKADAEDGTIDQTAVTDGDLLALTQTNFPTIAALYFESDGTLR